MEKKIDNDLLEKGKNSESSDKPVTESSNTEHLEGSPAEEENAELTAEQQQDEALFAALEKSKKQKKKKKIIIIVVIVAVLLIAGIIGTILLRKKVTTQFSKDDDEVLSAKAEKGTISTLVSGSGMLVNVDTETVSVPSGVEVTEILVEYGDTVKEGDMLAVVDMSTVRTAMTTLQESIEDLDDEIADAKGDTVSSSIYPPVSGRIKKVYAQKGDLVEDVMGNHGALALMSLDGYMTGELQTDKLKKGDAIKAVRADGTELEASVKNVIGKKATILVSDDGPEVDEEVKIVTDSGNEIGKIKLSINNPLSITGYAGTINYVYAKENAKVSSYSPLFTLSNTSTTASYDSLLRTRSDYEETLVELMKLQRNGGLTAPISGSIYSVADLDEDTTEEILDIVTISPDKYMEVSIEVDEANILSLEVGQSADVTVSSISDDVMEGTVTEIDKTYTSGSYTATVTLEKKTGMIPGMTADVDIRIEGAEDTLLIPADALHQTSSGYYVYTSYNEETKEYGGKVDVIPGLSNSDQVEIKSGLTEGQTVYYVEEEEFNPFGGGGFPGGGNMPGGQSGGGFPSGGGGPSGGPPSGGGPSGGPGGR